MPAGTHLEPVKRAVLSLVGEPIDRHVVDFGCKLARADRTRLVGVYVVEVDWRHDLDDELETEREEASRALDVAEGLAEREKVLLDTQLLQARDVGAALVDEAVALEADAIVLGLPYKVRFGGDFAIGQTIPYVFKNAPCRVFVVREPIAASETQDGDTKRF
ncbi:MAG TPA: universal stress protein [Candidatus Limnocylindrales bacterium]|nr:universal stress protein [Candidatus Limnocylindrales bacterium]